MGNKDTNALRVALRRASGTLWAVALFSCAINILMLTGPIFMLQVYDRVLSSRSVPTLVVLFGLVVVLFVAMGLFDFLRARALSRLGYRLEDELMAPVARLWSLEGARGQGMASRPQNDLATLREVFASTALPALFDLPWVPVYLIIVAMLHPWLGLLALAGAVLVALATVANEVLSRKAVDLSTQWDMAEANFAESARNQTEPVMAMGMTGAVGRTWGELRRNALAYRQAAGNHGEAFGAATRSLRLLLQSAILALGAYLALQQLISPGAMIAASILAGRALAPVDQVIGNWRLVIRARLARRRLLEAFDRAARNGEALALPRPTGRLTVNGVTKLARDPRTGQPVPVLQGIQFALEPGDGLGVLGSSGAGKSTLARLLVGIDAPDQGAVRLDGARFEQWQEDAAGRHVGYVPQSVSLLMGTVRDNIARFDASVTDAEVFEAATLAGVHEMILRLPLGYGTPLAANGRPLTGGQMQLVALARALLRRPALLVLDEPNANLDARSDDAMSNALMTMRRAGTTVVVIAHRPSAIAAMNKALMLVEGRQAAFGDRDEVLRAVLAPDAPVRRDPVPVVAP